MNRLFVNIKVDREERPDLDQIYQTAHHLLTRRNGGWPLTMFLAPDGTPFFGGTYFPREPRYGLPGFADVCQRVATAYRERREDIAAQAGELRERCWTRCPKRPPAAPSSTAAPLARPRPCWRAPSTRARRLWRRAEISPPDRPRLPADARQRQARRNGLDHAAPHVRRRHLRPDRRRLRPLQRR
jgi:hypothetical protein